MTLMNMILMFYFLLNGMMEQNVKQIFIVNFFLKISKINLTLLNGDKSGLDLSPFDFNKTWNVV